MNYNFILQTVRSSRWIGIHCEIQKFTTVLRKYHYKLFFKSKKTTSRIDISECIKMWYIYG